MRVAVAKIRHGFSKPCSNLPRAR